MKKYYIIIAFIVLILGLFIGVSIYYEDLIAILISVGASIAVITFILIQTLKNKNKGE